jgi:hypothetical protein
MKYILIIGRANDGKSTTIDAVCKQLKPTRVEKLDVRRRMIEEQDNSVPILNGTYIIEAQGKIILVVAGAPTEQGTTITVLINICIELKLKIEFALVCMRSYERSEGFNTRVELKELGQCILEE